ncbi:MAG TPA: DUF4199 domain-containing protein [Thermoanaerobaculia bacterium]|jgi:hypothetical protein|nr:DUF4199 domain-containing protein [Thermoanaerobaculia bacterium]
MKKIVLTSGLIAGSILAIMVALMIPMTRGKTPDFSNSMLVGYTSMIVAFLAIFFGIRNYREKIGGGTITFGRAFKVGILIVLLACGMYVVTWEIVYFGFIPDFGDKYAAYTLEKLRVDGASPTVIAAEQTKMAEFREWYKNPILNIGMTFMEVFPVGLIMTLVSAAILRKKQRLGMA